MGTKAGVPDLLLIINGVSYGLEIKRSTGRLTDCQRLMHAEMDRAGANRSGLIRNPSCSQRSRSRRQLRVRNGQRHAGYADKEHQRQSQDGSSCSTAGCSAMAAIGK